MPPLAPDVTAVLGGNYPGEEGSYHVGDDGPNPSFVVEITSPNKPGLDLDRKKWDYAAFAIPEYLIIDMWSEPKKPWQLYGYRLEHGPFYHEIKPDADGGLTFETVGLRFVGVGRTIVDVYDATNGQKLALPDDWMDMVRASAAARAEAEAERAQAEAARAETAEAQLAEALAQLKARLSESKDE